VRQAAKHNDLDNVEYTRTPIKHYFLKMLEILRFGLFFKMTAIPVLLEPAQERIWHDKEKLLVTVYHTDDEAAANLEKGRLCLTTDHLGSRLR